MGVRVSADCVGVGRACRRRRSGLRAGQGQGSYTTELPAVEVSRAADRGEAGASENASSRRSPGDEASGLSDIAGLDAEHRSCRRQGAFNHQLRRFRSNPAHQFAEHHGCPAAERAGRQCQRGVRQSFPAESRISRICGIARVGHAAGIGGVSERRAHQRGFRRHHQLGSDPDLRDQIGRRGDEQSRLRPQCAGWRRHRPDEGRLRLSWRRDRHDGWLVRPAAEFGAMGQAGRSIRDLRRARRAP